MARKSKSTRLKDALKVCKYKVPYKTHEYAESESLRIWKMKPVKANPATPYHCRFCGNYHLTSYVPPEPKATVRKWVVTFNG